ncbi:MAG: DUF4136 domain-containing protein [Enhygromyxa sp.]
MLRRLASLCCLCLPLTLPLAGCSKQLQAQTAYAQDVDFSQYQTYRWITDDLVLIQSGTGDDRIRNIDNERRIRTAVERELEAKGLRKAGVGEADLIVAFTLGTQVRYRIQGGANYDIVTDPAASYTRGVLTIYLFDRESQQQIWSARTHKNLEPGDNPDAVINTAVDVLLAEFPPTTSDDY